MILYSRALSEYKFDKEILKEDRKSIRTFGPCGLSEKAIYLNSFFIDRKYYLPYHAVKRAFKRVAMSKGGFTGRGAFASIAYLVVQYDSNDGNHINSNAENRVNSNVENRVNSKVGITNESLKEIQCIFKHEEDVDRLLEALSDSHPEIEGYQGNHSEQNYQNTNDAHATDFHATNTRTSNPHSTETRTNKSQATETLATEIHASEVHATENHTTETQATISELKKAEAFLLQKESLCTELSLANRAKRNFLQTKPGYKWAALAFTILGLGSLIYGITHFILAKGSFDLYFVLFGVALLFLFAGVSILPTAKNNRKAVMRRVEKAEANIADYISIYEDFPLPARYAHPIVLRRMIRALESCQVSTRAEAYEFVKEDLKAKNSSVVVEQWEYDEIIAIKALFLNNDYN